MLHFYKSFVVALLGIKNAFVQERNLKIHFLSLSCVLLLGAYFSISQLEWVAILVISALVISLEIVNSAIERLCNRITTERDEHIKQIKDMSAGAVLVAAVFALVIAVFIFGKYICP
jgi:diacylglycerol kinase